MTNAERIAYFIKKECGKSSLAEWCQDKGFTVNDFDAFLQYGKKRLECANKIIGMIKNEECEIRTVYLMEEEDDKE